MFYKFILSILFAVLCLGCSKKSVEDDLTGSELLAECLEHPDAPKCHVENSPLSCEDISGIDPCHEGNNYHMYVGSYASGDVIDFNWQNTLPWYYETENYPYGFDKDPMSNWPDRIETGKDVYVSVAEGELASVELKIPPEYKKTISLVSVESGIELCSGSACHGLHTLNAGNYKLMSDGVDVDRNLHIIAYGKKGPYAITYIQFDGEGGMTCSVDEGCYTQQSVQENLNKVLSQAVLSANLNKANPIDFGLGDIFEVDMTEKNVDPYYTTLVSSILRKNVTYAEYEKTIELLGEAGEKCREAMGRCRKVKCTGEGPKEECSYDCDSDEKMNFFVNWCNVEYPNRSTAYKTQKDLIALNGARAVLALNNVRLIWKLNDPNSLLSMNNYYDFAKAYIKNNKTAVTDGSLVPMFMKSYSNTCATGVGITPVPIYAKLISHNDKDDVFSVSLQDYAGRPVAFSTDCDYLYIDTYGFIPGEKGAAQIMWPFSVEVETIDDKKINKVAGGVAFAARQNGKYSKNTIVHEIGHTFGLSDIYIDPLDPSIAYCYQKTTDGYFVRDDIPLPYDVTGELVYNHYVYRRCSYTTTEADLMNYQVPTGPRLRYRPLPIVGTGTNIPNGTYDSQWECLQNADCGRYSE